MEREGRRRLSVAELHLNLFEANRDQQRGRDFGHGSRFAEGLCDHADQSGVTFDQELA
jgi:hypothetical protein